MNEISNTQKHRKDKKDHIIQKMSSKFGTDVDKLNNFSVNGTILSMFMNYCMWAVFYPSEEDEKIKKILVNHQIRKTQTIIETVQAKYRDLTNVAAEFYAISS